MFCHLALLFTRKYLSNRCFLYFAFKTQGSDKNAFFFFFWQPSIYEKAFYKVITGEIIMFWVRGQPIKRLPGNWPFPGTGRVDAQVRGGPPCSGFREGDALGARPPSNPDPSGDTQPPLPVPAHHAACCGIARLPSVQIIHPGTMLSVFLPR